MLDKLANITVGAAALGVVMVIVAGWLGEDSGPAWALWLGGAGLFVLSLPLIVIVGAILLVRRIGRATGAIPTPVAPTVPEPGWPGWRFALDGVEHELWVDDSGMNPSVLCDGGWAEARRPRGRRGGEVLEFRIAGHPALLVGHVDWHGTAKGLPIVIVAGLLGDSNPGPPPMRYDLVVDGVTRPDAERLVIGRDGDARPAPTRMAGPRPPGSPPAVDDVPGFDGDTSPATGRRIRADPPPR